MTDYLRLQLIAYIGNKRALLPFLEPLLKAWSGPGAVFVDAFAGSGAVSRLARTLGFAVHANDWEPYSQVVNQAFLTLTPSRLPTLFPGRGGLQGVLDELNALRTPREESIARWYAPRSTADADWRTERLFYTRENALWLDAVRERIDELDLEPAARTLLLALLVYEASVHANTNGVFKAFHKGFGGHGRDALGRILKRMQLEYPVLWESEAEATVSGLDAAAFLRSHPGDVIYLDPPYNQHQYGSNYHLLNTVVRGDRFVPRAKAGIRSDWTLTKSAFCSRRSARAAFRDLLDAADGRHLVVSYNTEGLVPFDELYELLAERGRVELRVQDYVTYRGGRQSPGRRAHNLEFVLTVDTRQKHRSSDGTSVRRFLTQKHLITLARGAFVPSRLAEHFEVDGDEVVVEGRRWRLDGGHRLVDLPDLTDWTDAELTRTLDRLAACACRSHPEEVEILIPLVEDSDGAVRRRRVRRLALVLKKFAFRQYRPEFERSFVRVRDLARRLEDELLTRLLGELRVVADRRFGTAEEESSPTSARF